VIRDIILALSLILNNNPWEIGEEKNICALS
jgi:hypothetical protein